jgi:FMN phosphatase YigB (HAD superfamily)
VLLVDVMGTLVYDPFYVEVPAFFGTSLRELLRAKHPTAWAEFETGAIDEDELRRRFFADGRDYDHEGMKACMSAAFRLLDGVEALLAELVEAGYELHALSNYSAWYHLIEQRLELTRFLAWSFVSCDTGVRKPAREAYLGAARALGVAPGECLFVDDREENCAGARACGMPAVRCESAAGLRAELVRRGLLA